MDREDIIRMAREAGLHSVDLLDLYGGNVKDSELAKLRGLIRFAHLIYEATFRDANIAASRTILDAAVLEEREACAKLLERGVDMPGLAGDPVMQKYTAELLLGCAAAIRARSNP